MRGVPRIGGAPDARMMATRYGDDSGWQYSEPPPFPVAPIPMDGGNEWGLGLRASAEDKMTRREEGRGNAADHKE